MKKIKTFESFCKNPKNENFGDRMTQNKRNKNNSYDINDYIIINQNLLDIWKKNKVGIVNKVAKIINFDLDHSTYEKQRYYHVEAFQNNQIEIVYLNGKNFVRKANIDEIEEFETLKNASKYNL